jgi:LAS superfamily LD-carboxypeptidase LdcB
MKVRRTIALLLIAVSVSSFAFQAKAASDISLTALEQCAAELSQCTGWKYYKNENTERYISYRLIHPDYTLDAIISYVNIGLDNLFYSNPVEIPDPNSTAVLVNKYRPLPPDFVPARLEKINSTYSYGTQKLTHDARVAFEKLCAAAKKAGYPIWAVSSYRDYKKQAEVYDSFLDPDNPNSVVTRDLIAARPGFSEHQTGLAVDFSRVDASVKSADIHKWMGKNAHKYGFIVRYPAGKEGVTGVTNEPWHLRYLGVQLATAVYGSGWTYDEYYAREIDIPIKSADTAAIGVTALSKLAVDGIPYQLSVYRVFGDTYYKLRDIAVILNGTPASFDVTWNDEFKRIEMIRGVPYASDMLLGAFETGAAGIMMAARPGFMSDEILYDLSSYVTGGSNYFKLSDILDIMGVTATEDGAGGLIINTIGDAPGTDIANTPSEAPNEIPDTDA